MPTEKKKKKYTLFNTNDGRPNSEKPCAFFFSNEGCRNGDKCTFRHTPEDTASVSDMSEVPEIQSSKPIIPSGDMATREKETREIERKKAKKEKKERKVKGSVGPPLAEPEGEVDNQLKVMQERLKQMEQQLAAAEQGNNIGKVAPSATAKSAKKDKHQTPGGQVVATTPAMGLHMQRFDSGTGPMSVAQSAMAPPPGLHLHEGARSVQVAEMSGGQPAGLRPKSNFLSPTFGAGGGGPGTEASLGRTSMMSMSTNTKKSKRREEEEDTAFLFGAVNAVINPSPTAMTSTGGQGPGPVIKNLSATSFLPDGSFGSTPNVLKQGPSQTHTPGGSAVQVAEALTSGLTAETGGFVFLEKESVMKTLSTSGTDHATGTNSGKASTAVEAATAAKSEEVLHAIRTADTNSLEWGKLVYATQQNHRFNKEYNFDTDNTWVRAHAYGQWCAELPPVLAIDCEMCGTKDPVTGERFNNSLIRFSVVNGLRPEEVLVDQLVKPSFPIVESRAHIHGIHPDNLEGVTYTLRHAQAALMQLCSDHTIIVGHSVHNDLKALKFLHHTCIDTSYLYAVENEPWSLPSMRDVSQHILGSKLSDVHDSVQDARAAHQAAMYLLVQGCPEKAPQCPRTGTTPSASLSRQLLAHRLPDWCDRNHVLAMIIKYTKVVPDTVEAITSSGTRSDGVHGGPHGSGDSSSPRGKVVVTFESQAHAELAFNTIPGPNRPDKAGKAQKRVYLKSNGSVGGSGGGYINLRKQV